MDAALNENKIDSVNGVNSVFYSILSEKDLDIRDKKSAIIDFIAAGIETLANTLIFILHHVTSNRDGALDKIKEEFAHCSNHIDSNDLAQAVFTKACLQETYRICPTAFCLARILQEDTHLSGYCVKAGVSSKHMIWILFGNRFSKSFFSVKLLLVDALLPAPGRFHSFAVMSLNQNFCSSNFSNGHSRKFLSILLFQMNNHQNICPSTCFI